MGQIGAAGVSDGVVTTIPLASTTNLPTDTGVVAVIDRVDVNGTATTTLEETVLGVVSGTNLVTATRGAEGTAQPHDAGAVVEILFTNKGWTDVITGLLVQHDQAGLHTNITACNITASGTNYGKFVTGSTVTASDITATRAMSASTLTSSDVTATRAMSASTITASDVTATRNLSGFKVPRIQTVADAATITPTGDTADEYTVTALAQAATIAAPSGTPVNGQKLILRFLDNGTGRALTWNAIYKIVGVTLPTTTVASKYTYVGCIYSTADTKWHVVAVNNEA